MPIEHLFDDRNPDGPPAQVPAPRPLDAPIQARIDGWRPRGVDDTDEAHEVVDTCRAIVAAARPAHPKQATSVLSSTREFLVWLLANGAEAELADGSALLTPDRIAAYREDPDGLGGRPQGSVDAITSFLTRVAFGGVGLPAPDDEGHGPGAADPVLEVLGIDGNQAPAGPEVAATTADLTGLGHQVGAVLASYAPSTLSPARWNRIAAFTRAAVATAAPGSAQAARDSVRSVAYLAAWIDAGQRPVRTDTMFAPDTLATYITVLTGRMETPTAAHHRTNVVRVGTAVLPGADYSQLPSITRKKPEGAATPNAVMAGQQWALNRRTAKARRHSAAVIVLGAGCGLSSVDAAWVTPDDVVEIGAGLGVDVRRPGPDGTVELRRTTFVLPGYADQLRELAAEATAAGDAFLVGAAGRRDRRVATILLRDDTGIDMIKLRYQWMLEILDGGLLPIETFLAASGLETLRVVEDLLDSRPAPTTALTPLMHTQPGPA